MSIRPLVAIAALFGSSCAGGSPIRPTQAIFDPASLPTSFWSIPFPSDLRKESDGSYGLARWPNAAGDDLVKMWLGAADDRLHDGFGVSAGAFAPLTGPIDPASLPADPSASLDPGSSVFFLDIDPASPERGRRFPLEVSFLTEGDLYSPSNLLAAVPVFGFVRRPTTLYALVLTDRILDRAGVPLGRSRAFDAAVSGAASADPAFKEHLRPLVAELEREHVSLDRVVGAAVFTTLDPNEVYLRIARWTEAQPLPAMTPWKAADAYPEFQVLTGHYTAPVIQNGVRPYAQPGQGRIVWNDAGEPVIQSTQQVRLALTIPRGPQPASGWPLAMYLHGSGGDYRQAIDRGARPETEPDDGPSSPPPGTGPAKWLAQRGVATLAFDFPLHGDRSDPPDTTGLMLYNLLGNVDATIDNFRVAAMELLLISRIATSLAVSSTLATSLDPGSAPDRVIRFDPARLSAMGQSMGTTLGIPWAGLDPRLKGAVFSGTGGILVEIANTAIEPVMLKGLLEGLLGLTSDMKQISPQHPLLHAMQNLWDLVDPVAKAEYLAASPHDGVPAKDVFMTAGFRDGYFDPIAQAAVAVPLGAPLVGAAVEPTLDATLRLAGRSPAAYPLAANLGGRTVGVVQYTAPNNLGHYVVFNQQGARDQYTCFLATVGTAGGAQLRSADAATVSCP
jgi:hypothetical protein